MKRATIMIGAILAIGLIFIGCGGSDDSSVNTGTESGTETSFNFTLTSLKRQETAAGKMASFTADQVMTGQLQATNTDTSVAQTFDWSIYFDEDTYAAQSNKTIILAPGTYEFALLLIKGDQQYAGSVAGISISDGTFDVPMTIRPVIGDTITDVTLVASLAEFKFQYDPAELAAASLVNPQMGIIINGGAEAIYGINPANGISDTWINLDDGASTLQLKLYDGSLQVGRSITAQESLIVTAGLNITMDLVALHGETTFALTEAGGNANFSFNIPADVVNEAGGLGNLQVLFSLVGPNNPLDENPLTLAPDGTGDYEAGIVLSNKQFDEVTLSLAFTDTSVSELLGSCAVQATLDTTQRTLNCDVTLRRRAIIGGSLLATLGINVFNEAGEPVAGATVTENGNILGITGSGAFGTEGYLKVYKNAGNYTLQSAGELKYGQVAVTLTAFDIENVSIVLNSFPTSCSTAQDFGVKNTDSSTGDGVYYIDPDGAGGAAETAVYCDMTRDGGGWTLVAKVSDAGDDYPAEKLDYDSAFWNSTNTLNNGISYLNTTDYSRNTLTPAYSLNLQGTELRYIQGGIESHIVTFDNPDSVKGWKENSEKSFTYSFSTPWLCGFMIDETDVEDGRYASGKVPWYGRYKYIFGCIHKGGLFDYPSTVSAPTDDRSKSTFAIGSKYIQFRQADYTNTWGNDYHCAENVSWVNFTGGSGDCPANYIGGTNYAADKRWGDLWVR